MSTFATWTSGRNVRARQRFARRAAGSVLAAVIAALGLIVAPLTATAAEAELETSKVAWYFDSTAGTSATGAVGVEVPDQEPPPANPTVPPNTLPAGMQNAEHQYRSAIKFDLSAVPAGAEVDSFTFALHENSSSGTVTGLEACAFTADFAEGANQHMNDLPEVSCIFSTQAEKPEEDDPDTERDETAYWIFEMPDTAQSWLTDPSEGGIENHGLVIQYIPPPNLQVGEPDPTQSSGRIFFDGPESETPPVATIEYTVGSGEQDSGTVELEPVAPPAQSDSSSSGGTDGSTSGSSGSGFGFASSPQFESQPSQSQPGPEIAQEPAPEVADESGGGEPAPETAEPVAAPASQQVPVTTPAYVWALIPLGFAALYVLSRSLTAEPQVAVEREGVMTRLIERRRAEASSSSAAEALLQV